MKNLPLHAIVIGFLVSALVPSSKAATATSTLLNETFVNGSYGTGNNGATSWKDTTVGSSGYGSVWTWSAVAGQSGNSPTDQETYSGSSSDMGARSMPVLASKDGGFEVISDPNPVGVNGKGPGTWMVDTKVSIPTSFTSLQSAEVSFDYGFRGGVLPSSFSLYDTTSKTSLYSASLSSTSTSTWSLADFIIGSSYLTGVKSGDALDLQWITTSASSAQSLEVGGPVKFTVTGVTSAPGAPTPPLTACLAFAGVLLLQTLRSRKTA